jgi:polyisoprenyl-phosphate glycosyltransferase
VVDAIKKFTERNLYFPGLRAWAGFRQTGVEVPRRSRHDKHSRVGLRRLWKLSTNAIFSFSYVVLFVFRIIGTLSIVLALGILVFAFSLKHSAGRPIGDSLLQIVVTTFFAGINLLGISVVGEYVARIYDEVKSRPRYIVSHEVTHSNHR